MHHNFQIVKACQTITKDFLVERGFKPSGGETKIIYTCLSYKMNNQALNF